MPYTSSISISQDRVKKTINNYSEHGVFGNEVSWLKTFVGAYHFPSLISSEKDTETIFMKNAGSPINAKNIPDDWQIQVLEIMNGLRHFSCCHNDIKEGEVLVNSGIINLCDFGWATKANAPVPKSWPHQMGCKHKNKGLFDDDYAIKTSIKNATGKLFNWNGKLPRKKLSIIVCAFNMSRELRNTLFTLTPEYQGVSSDLYNVLVVENFSTLPIDRREVLKFGSNFHYFYNYSPFPSPVFGINKAIELVDSDYISIAIDGARMLSPNVIKKTFESFSMSDHPFSYCLGMHIGSMKQNSTGHIYNKEIEDKLLSSVDWKRDGYELFGVSCPVSGDQNGFYAQNIMESNFFSMRKSDFEELGCYNDGFVSKRGGYG